MPIKFTVKIVWLKVYMTIVSPMTLTFVQGHKCLKLDYFFNLQYLGQYLSYGVQTWHDGRLMDLFSLYIYICSYLFRWPWYKVTVGLKRPKISVACSPTKQEISFKLATTVGHFYCNYMTLTLQMFICLDHPVFTIMLWLLTMPHYKWKYWKDSVLLLLSWCGYRQ